MRFVRMSALCAGLILAAGTAVAADAPAASLPAASPFHVDRSHTFLTFSLSHFGFSTATGGFKTFDVAAAFDPKAPEKTTIDVKIDATSIDTGWPARDQDLKDKGFFNVAQFPAVTFKSTSVKKTGATTAKLTGDLTMLGVTKPITFSVKLLKMAPSPFRPSVEIYGFQLTGTLKRSAFGMTSLISQGLGDDVTLSISTEINNSPVKTNL